MRFRHCAFIGVTTAMLLLGGCGGSSGTTAPSVPQFSVATVYGPSGAIVANASQQFEGTSQQSQTNCSGQSQCITDTGLQTTDSNGAYTVQTLDLPDYWGFTTYQNSNCPQNTTFPAVDVQASSTLTLACGAPTISFKASPAAWIHGGSSNPPAPTSITLTASSPAFPTSGGLPVVSSYTESATLETQITATSVNSENVVFPVNSTLLEEGFHILVVRAANGNVIGAAPFHVYVITVPPPCPTAAEPATVPATINNPNFSPCG